MTCQRVRSPHPSVPDRRRISGDDPHLRTMFGGNPPSPPLEAAPTASPPTIQTTTTTTPRTPRSPLSLSVELHPQKKDDRGVPDSTQTKPPAPSMVQAAPAPVSTVHHTTEVPAPIHAHQQPPPAATSIATLMSKFGGVSATSNPPESAAGQAPPPRQISGGIQRPPVPAKSLPGLPPTTTFPPSVQSLH